MLPAIAIGSLMIIFGLSFMMSFKRVSRFMKNSPLNENVPVGSEASIRLRNLLFGGLLIFLGIGVIIQGANT